MSPTAKNFLVAGGALAAVAGGIVLPLTVIDSPAKGVALALLAFVVGVFIIRIYGMKTIVFPTGQRMSTGQNGFDYVGVLLVIFGAVTAVVAVLRWVFGG